MANNKNPNQKLPGEKSSGTFHFNPGNMSGKTMGTHKDEFDKSDADRMPSRHEKQDKNEKPPTDGE